MLIHYNPCIKIVFFFSKRTVKTCSGKGIFYKTSVLHTLFDVRKTGVDEHTFVGTLMSDTKASRNKSSHLQVKSTNILTIYIYLIRKDNMAYFKE